MQPQAEGAKTASYSLLFQNQASGLDKDGGEAETIEAGKPQWPSGFTCRHLPWWSSSIDAVLRRRWREALLNRSNYW